MAFSNQETLKELEIMQQLGPKQSALNFIINLQRIIIIVAGWASVSVEIFIRFSFGERYFNFLRVLLGYLTFRFFAGIIWIIASLPALVPRPGNITQPLPVNFVLIFTLLYWGFALAQLLLIGWRNRRGDAWHSESFGISIFSFLLIPLMPVSRFIFGNSNPEFLLYRVVEPAAVAIIGIGWSAIDRVTGIWILTAALALMIRNNLVYNAQRHRMLDRSDAQIENQVYQLMQEQMEKGRLSYRDMNKAGYSVIPISAVDLRAEMAERQNVKDVVAATMGMETVAE